MLTVVSVTDACFSLRAMLPHDDSTDEELIKSTGDSKMEAKRWPLAQALVLHKL